MVDNLYSELLKTILDVNTEQEATLVVHVPDIGKDENEWKSTEETMITIARSVLPPAKETEVITGDLLNSLEKVKKVVRQSSSSQIFLLPSWESLRSIPKEHRQELEEAIHKKYALPRNASFFHLAVFAALQIMDVGKRLLVLLPVSFLTDHQSQPLRAYIAEEHSVEWIVQSSGWPVLPGIHRAFTVCSVLIQAGQPKSRVTRMFRAPEVTDVSATKLLEEIGRLSHQQGGRTTNGYILRQKLPENERWDFSVLHPRWNEYLKDLSALGGTLLLGEIAAILRAHSSRLSHDTNNREKVEDAVLISGRQITLDGQLILERDKDRPAFIEHLELQPGDIVMRSLIAAPDNESLPVARVPTEVQHSVYADQNVIVIRLRNGIDSIDSEWLLSFLQSPRAADWIRSRTAMQIHPGLLEDMPIPVQDDDTAALWQQVERLIDEMRGWQDHLGLSRRQLFRQSTIREGHAALIAATLEGAQRVRAARETQNFGWKVRNLYPYPLAFRWREIETMENGHRKYQRLLDAAEILAAYLAVMALVMAENYRDGQLPGYLQTVKERLSTRPKNGMNFGDWLALLTEISEAKQYRSVGPGTPFYESASFLRGETQQAFEYLKTARDNNAHGRGPTSDAELEEASVEARFYLEKAYRRAEFLTQYPLRYLEKAVYLVRRKTTEYVYRDLMGDHPLVSAERAIHSGSNHLQQDALYFGTPNNDLFLVNPWLVRRMCPTCGSKEVYVFDHLNSKTGAVVVKSLEYGHVIETDDLYQDLQQLGILPD